MRREVDEEILDIIPERFVDRLDSRMGGAGRGFRQIATIFLAATAVAAAVAGWYVLTDKSGPGLQADVPVIKADSRPIKARPENPGGMVVPNQDKLIYEGLGRGEQDSRVERLLPPPEQPKAPPVELPPAGQEAVPASPPPAASVASPVAPPPAPAPAAQPPQAVAQPAQPVPQPTAPAPVRTAPAPTKPAAAVETLPSAAAVRQGPARGEYMIQLAAMGSTDAAQKEWVRIKKANSDLLGTLASDIVKVDLGAKGVFYRLRAGPMDELSARTLCGQMTKRNVGCMVVRK